MKVQLRERPILAMGHMGNGEADSVKALQWVFNRPLKTGKNLERKGKRRELQRVQGSNGGRQGTWLRNGLLTVHTWE